MFTKTVEFVTRNALPSSVCLHLRGRTALLFAKCRAITSEYVGHLGREAKMHNVGPKGSLAGVASVKTRGATKQRSRTLEDGSSLEHRLSLQI